MTRVTTGPPPVQREAEEQALRRIRSNAVTASSEVRRTDHSLIADEVTKEGAAPRDERNLHGVADTAAAEPRSARIRFTLSTTGPVILDWSSSLGSMIPL